MIRKLNMEKKQSDPTSTLSKEQVNKLKALMLDLVKNQAPSLVSKNAVAIQNSKNQDHEVK